MILRSGIVLLFRDSSVVYSRIVCTLPALANQIEVQWLSYHLGGYDDIGRII